MPLQLAVLNAGGRDREQSFPNGPGSPDDPGPHPPINFHAYAACTGGSFHNSAAAALATKRPILLLLRRDLRAGWRCLQQLKNAGRSVAVSFKEAGALQVAERLTSPADIAWLDRIYDAADGFLAPAPWLQAFYPGTFIPTPYPVDDPRWDFSRPDDERRGIFIGTREWFAPARQHLAALLAARRLHALTGERVTVINTDKRRGARLLEAAGFSTRPDAALRIIPGPLAYPAYLREIAGHKIVFQLDRSGVPGQVAGDALLCRVPCVGGDGAVDQIAFPGLSGVGQTPEELVEIARSLLEDFEQRRRAAAGAHALARERLSFPTVARKLGEFFEGGEARGDIPVEAPR